MKQKPTKIPTVTPNTLRNVVFNGLSWQTLHNRNLATFHLNRIEDARQGIRFPIPPHRKTVIDFIVLTRGSMVRRIGLTRHEVPARSFIFLPAYQICSDEWMSEDIQGYYCHFAPELLTKQGARQAIEQEFAFLHFQGHPPITLDETLFNDMLGLVTRLERVYQNKQADDMDLLGLYLLTLFTELQQALPPGLQSVRQPGQGALRTTELYKQALTQFIYENRQISDYARLLHISPNHLNKCVKRTTGQSARELLDEMVLLEAKVLLTHTDLSISEIAFKIGRQEPGNFTRFFRKKTGLSPRRFRLRE
ncbi:helix-turn-helix domain-containing protein [Spirosoma linguale]|uniref:Transcriptional regulator, AraC family n=1 Tax=Spirosoma linguale (strain ATCC 33905 / DSM 74 / LMG 10896 / Claus 1) TaxID=504472 RepID=D2QG80_SPILD|nr:transcriptional regulator, AraC family [Spirosoma linguale DSM 74]